jgi:hypothetical protein
MISPLVLASSFRSKQFNGNQEGWCGKPSRALT